MRSDRTASATRAFCAGRSCCAGRACAAAATAASAIMPHRAHRRIIASSSDRSAAASGEGAPYDDTTRSALPSRRTSTNRFEYCESQMSRMHRTAKRGDHRGDRVAVSDDEHGLAGVRPNRVRDRPGVRLARAAVHHVGTDPVRLGHGRAVSRVRTNSVVMTACTCVWASAAASAAARRAPASVSGGSAAGVAAFSAWRTRMTTVAGPHCAGARAPVRMMPVRTRKNRLVIVLEVRDGVGRAPALSEPPARG